MKDATKLIHAGETVDTGATPSLTTPIYETSTFVFDSVADVIKYQEGKLDGYLYSRYENPTVVAVEQKVAAIDGAETVVALQLRNGGDRDGDVHAAQVGRRDRVQRGDLRRHVSHHRRSALEGGHHAPLRLARRSRESCLGDRPEDEDRVVRVADQPDAALRRCSHGGRGLQEGRRDFGDRQHLREPDQPAGARDGHRSLDAELHEVLERP